MTQLAAPKNSARHGRATRPGWVFFGVLAVISLVVAAVVALVASADPDGLERVAIDTGFAAQAEESAVSDSPLADYTLGGEQDSPEPWRNAVAGVIGVGIMAAVAFAVFGLLSRGVSSAESDVSASLAAESRADTTSVAPGSQAPHPQGRGGSAAQQ